tara:strand:+ start:65 stop:511 length:447 start_codon:yes stop_codon:yes gene_type:complete
MSPASSDFDNSSSMVIPVGLIPSEEKKEVDKRKLAFAVLTSIIFFIPLGVGFFEGLRSLMKPPLTPRQVFVSGALSAYKCQVFRGRVSPAEGRARLEKIFEINSLDPSIVDDPLMNDIAGVFAQMLDVSCSSAGMDEVVALNRIYRRL